MSYVGLKHRLADLTLEAVAAPQSAHWVPLLFECAHRADMDETGVEWATLRRDAGRLGESFDWDVSERALEHLEHARLLVRVDHRIAIAPAFRPYRDYMRRQTLALLSFLSRYLYHPDPPATGTPRALWQGCLLFNDGLYFECHELLEGAWKQTAGPEKNFLHGLVQAAAAFYHYEKGNMHGARTLLGKALRRLEQYSSPYFEVDLEGLRHSLERWQARFAAESRSEADPERPIIRFTTSWVELGINY